MTRLESLRYQGLQLERREREAFRELLDRTRQRRDVLMAYGRWQKVKSQQEEAQERFKAEERRLAAKPGPYASLDRFVDWIKSDPNG